MHHNNAFFVKMKTPFVLFLLVSVVVVVVSLALPVVVAQEMVQEEDEEKTIKYTSSMILQSIGDINKKDGRFWSQFVLVIESDDDDFQKNPPELEFIGGRNIHLYDPDILPHRYTVTVEGEFFTKMDFHDHPFESIPLKLIIEPAFPHTSDKVTFVAKEQQPMVHSSVNVPGWDVRNPSLASQSYMYPDGFEFSRLVATFPVERDSFGVALRTLFPVSIITAVSLIIFFIPENFTPRIYLTAPLLLALVYLHQANLEHIPPVGYLTVFDKIMLIYYAIFVNSIVALGIQMRIHTSHNGDARVKKCNKIQLYLVPVIVLAGIAVLWNA